ncbi:hypothetical protein GCM10027195_03230 [Comamonas sediminis]
MKVAPCLDALISQAEFAEIIGVSEARVSQLVSEGVIARGDTCAGWLLAYCERLRDQAAGRVGADGAGGLDLVQERAALAREQRIAQAMKNKVASGEFAPIGILADVLGQAASGVVDRMDQLEGDLRKACPDLPEDARAVVLSVVAKARNEWLRSTAKLVADKVDELADDVEDEAAVMEDND